MLEQIQPSRWSPTAWSCGALLQRVGPRLAGGFISAELAAAAAAACIFAPRAMLCTGRVAAWSSEPPARLVPPALEPAWPGTFFRCPGARGTFSVEL